MDRETLVVNLMGPPGTGKSTMCAEIFAKLKWLGINCELVGEFAKELVWEERHETMKDELYLFAKQNHRIVRLQGKVDVIVTDRPLILSILYNDIYGDSSQAFKDIVLHEVDKSWNLNYLLERTKKYAEEGRVQTEDESNAMGQKIMDMLDDVECNYRMVLAQSSTSDDIVSNILYQLKENS